MVRDSTFLAHSISAPDFPPTKAHRPRLTDDLQRHLDRDLVLIVAPAGYGKTTFLADFSAQAETPVCWVRLSEADCDPNRLAGLVWETLCRRFRRLRKVLSLDEEVGVTPLALARMMGQALFEKVSEPFVLILDDFHLIHPSQDSTGLIDTLLTELPSAATVVIASRELPHLSLAQWIANDRVKTFGPEELALTMEELNQLAEQRLGRPLPEDVLAHVLAETEGWVTGVLLSDRVMGESLPMLAAQPEPLAYDYLANTAFEREANEVQTFMLESSVMPIMTPRACDQVLGRTDGQRMLSRLLRKGLFVTATSGSPRVYEYHHLFRSYLLEQLEQADPALAHDLRLAAAEYFSESGWPEVAFDLCIDAGDWGRAGEVAEGNVKTLYELGQDQTVLKWAEELWDRGVAAPSTYSRAARSLGILGRFGSARCWLRRAESAVEGDPDPDKLMFLLHSRAIVHYELVNSPDSLTVVDDMRDLADVDNPVQLSMLRVCEASRELHRGADAKSAREFAEAALENSLRAEEESLIAHSYMTLGICKCVLGNPSDGLLDFRRSLAFADGSDLNRRKPGLLNNIGYSELFVGDFDSSLETLSEGLELSRQMCRPREEIECLVSLGDAYRYLSNQRRARYFYDRAISVSNDIGSDTWSTYCQVNTAATHRMSGDYGRAKDELAKVTRITGLPIYDCEQLAELFCSREYSQVSAIVARVQELQGDPRATVISNARAMIGGVLHLLGISCLDEARTMLTEALRYAKSTEMMLVIASEMAWNRQLLRLVENIDEELEAKALALRYERMIRDFNGKQVSSDPTEPMIEITALGGFALKVDGESLNCLIPLHIEILAYIVDRQSVPREQLRETFWRGQNRDQQRASLSTAIHEVREALGPSTVETVAHSYAIADDLDLRYDAREFEERALGARAAPWGSEHKIDHLLSAYEMYAGDFMSGFSSDWTMQRRRELEHCFLEVCRGLARVHIESGRDEKAERVLDRARKLDPYDEHLLSMQLGVLRRSRRLHEAILIFRVYEKRLVEDLHLEPSDDLKKQLRKIRGSRSAAHWMLGPS
jgi:DNA-binding SARP family transcriptional activator